MKKNILLGTLFASLLLLAGCDYNEDNFPGYDEYTHAKDIRNDTITLVKANYKKIATLKANRELALSKDPEGQTFLKALDQLTSNGFFTEEAPAAWYLPAYVDSVFPYLSNKSKVLVNYQNAENLPEYMADFNGIKDYDLTSEDYKSVWGDKVNALYISPAKVKMIPEVLAAANPNAKNGDMLLVNYAYSETEPSTGGGSEPEPEPKKVYQLVKEVDEAGGNYVILSPDKDANLIPFGKLQDETKDFGYMAGEAVAVADGLITSDVTDYVLTITPTDKGYSLKRQDGKYIYMSGNYNKFNLSASMPEKGGDWVFTDKATDNLKSVINVEKNKTIKLNFYVDRNSYSYGAYSGSKSGSYLDESFMGNTGRFTVQDVTMNEPLNRVWSNTDNYGWKVSATINKVSYPSESWLVSPEVDLDKANTPVLAFEHALNFLNGNNRVDFMDLKISSDYKDNVATATWETLSVPVWPEGKNWNFVESGNIDLSAYKGKKIRIAFVYKSTSDCGPTFEVKNLTLTDEVEGYYADVHLYKEISEDELAPATFASTRAAVKANTSAVYRYDATTATWTAYEPTDKNTDLVVLQPADYEPMGYNSISDPSVTLPIFLTKAYPYVKADDKKVAVYYYYDSSAKKTTVAATEFTYDGAAWLETATDMPARMLFVKSNDKWIEAKVYYENTLLGGNDGGFTIQDIELGGLSKVWSIERSYGWKATGYNGENQKAESWIVSPEISLEKAAVPVLRFDAAINHLKGNKVSDYFVVKLSTDYVDDVTKATWVDLTITGWPVEDSWSFVTVDPCELGDYSNQKIRIAFQYKSDEKAAATVEIKNLSIQE